MLRLLKTRAFVLFLVGAFALVLVCAFALALVGAFALVLVDAFVLAFAFGGTCSGRLTIVVSAASA